MRDPRIEDEPEAVSRARLAAIVASSDDIIVSKTLEGVITSWNPAAERTFGWTASEAVGRHITLIVPEDRRAEEEEVLARIRRGERVDHFESVRVTKDGRLVDVSIAVSPLRDAAGHIVGASKVARDIGDRRRLEAQRAHMLAREQEARRRAEALNNTKDELLATVSHELRTPLNAIFGWARLLQSGELDAAATARAVNTILRNASAQARLIEDLLDLSRLAAGRMGLDFEPVDLNTVIEAALDTVRPAAHAKSIALVATLDPSIGTLEGAPDRLQQVVWNLLLNSVKFTPPGGRVEIASRRGAEAVVIAVADTGRGIAPDMLPHVFEPFRQEDSSATRTEGGLGLGLALVRRLVELHGGQVVAHSAGKGHGATFTVTLPLPLPAARGDRATPEGASPEGASPGRESSGPLEGARVLVVDDDVEFLELSTMALRRAGAEVRAVSSAPRAHELVESWLPNVVLTDLAMPGEDGFALGKAMRMVFTQRRVQASIIALTAYGTSESRARALRAGFDSYLTKPIDLADLTRAVGDALPPRP